MALSSVSSTSLEDRRGYLTLVVTAAREGRLLLRCAARFIILSSSYFCVAEICICLIRHLKPLPRKTEGIREWRDVMVGLLGREAREAREQQSTR